MFYQKYTVCKRNFALNKYCYGQQKIILREKKSEKKFFFNVWLVSWFVLFLRQFASSLPSLQSESPSHLHFLWIHSPELHCISLDEHLAGGVGLRPQRDGDSSDWSWGEKTRGVSQITRSSLFWQIATLTFFVFDWEMTVSQYSLKEVLVWAWNVTY